MSDLQTCQVNGCDLTNGTGSDVIGVEVRGVYDGVAYWQCPTCGATWHRFEEGDYRRNRLACAGVVIP